jgi:hypothetical protein
MSRIAHRHAAEAALVREIDKARALHAERSRDATLDRALERLAQWQSNRLLATYADLVAQPRFRDAIAFFRSDLYGGEDIARRDADLARVVPLMSAALPEKVIATVARAMELNVLSQSLDRLVLAQLPRADGPFSVAEYCRAYRTATDPEPRRHQIALIVEIGSALDAYVRKPLLRTTLSMMRRPAKLAGVGALHDFLERGFDAFKRMHGAAGFLETVSARETAILEAIFAGSDDAFADPGSAPA